MCETKYLSLREEHRFKVSAKKVPFFSCFEIHISSILSQCSCSSLVYFPFTWYHHAACMPVHPLFNIRTDWFLLNLVLALFGPMRWKLQWRKLHHEELHNFPSLQILQLWSTETWDRWNTHHEWRMIYVYKIFAGKLQRKELLGKPWHR